MISWPTCRPFRFPVTPCSLGERLERGCTECGFAVSAASPLRDIAVLLGERSSAQTVFDKKGTGILEQKPMARHLRLAQGNRRAIVILALVAAFVRLPLAAQNTSITGVVKSSSGQAVAGALVRVRSEPLGLGFMVVSQAQGRYNTPSLLPGKYPVQG